jgi:hypothetical protein
MKNYLLKVATIQACQKTCIETMIVKIASHQTSNKIKISVKKKKLVKI